MKKKHRITNASVFVTGYLIDFDQSLYSLVFLLNQAFEIELREAMDSEVANQHGIYDNKLEYRVFLCSKPTAFITYYFLVRHQPESSQKKFNPRPDYLMLIETPDETLDKKAILGKIERIKEVRSVHELPDAICQKIAGIIGR